MKAKINSKSGANGRKSQMTPGQAIHKFCVQCVCSSFEVTKCGGNNMLGGQGDKSGVCYFFLYRLGKGRPSVKIIRKFCLECQGGDKTKKRQPREVSDGVKFCPSENCTLYPFRLGKNPNVKRVPIWVKEEKLRRSAVS